VKHYDAGPRLAAAIGQKMKIRDSGMPDQETWEGFFDATLTLRRLAFPCGSADVADFGCGYGTFSLAAARLTRGTVHALDIDPHMVAATAQRAQQLGLTNVRAIERDFVAEGTGLTAGSVAYAMLFNLLHAEEAIALLAEAHRVLSPDGVLAVIHWVHDAGTPRGPPLAIRPRPESCSAWARQVGFLPEERVVALPPHHYGLIARKLPPSTGKRQGAVRV
jgi:SAM-dependent methyltransferase